MKSMKPFRKSAQVTATTAGEPSTRRTWMERIGLGALFASVVGMGTAMVRSLVPNILYEPPQRFKAGLPEQFAEGATFLEDQRVFIFRDQKTFYAISAVCQHLGCTVELVNLNQPKTVTVDGRRLEEHREFHCPCHGSKYYGNGVNYSGPAPRPLEWYRLAVSPDDGQLIVDLSEPVNRDFRLSV
jgi:menaquinol-cytochrome c reductase iron-sulfur subunit